MKKPLTLSIVIPAYNESIHLVSCLDAIANQEIMPNEVIVVDNNSTDKTAKVANKYNFVKVVRENQQGIVYARDRGFNETKCDIIARIDADSILPPNWVKTVLDYYKDGKHANYAWTSSGFFYNIHLPRFHSWVHSQIIFRFNRLLLGHYILWGSTMAIPHSQWLKVRGKICLRNDIHEDLDLAIHLHRLGVQITYDTSIKVGVLMRRIDTADRHKLWEYLLLWPQTLKVHHFKRWLLSWFGAAVIYSLSPLVVMDKKFSELRNKVKLKNAVI